jgi:hypothetical protein
VDTGITRRLAAYGRWAITPGPLLGVLALLGLLGGAAAVATRRGIAAETLLYTSFGVLLPLVAAMTSMFDYRYSLPSIVVLPAAGALGASASARAVASAWTALAQTRSRPVGVAVEPDGEEGESSGPARADRYHPSSS